ncbi:MAG: type II secretion system protein GspM [Hyphomicrobium sp.]
MMNLLSWTKGLGGRKLLAPLIYVFILLFSILSILFSFFEMHASQSALYEAQDRLNRLQGLSRKDENIEKAKTDLGEGTVFITADKPSLGAADLQKKVETTLQELGGDLISSEVEENETKGPAVILKLIVECELPQSLLQKFLYQIESGTPFVFIDQMTIQKRMEEGSPEDPKLKISLHVSATWRSTPA